MTNVDPASDYFHFACDACGHECEAERYVDLGGFKPNHCPRCDAAFDPATLETAWRDSREPTTNVDPDQPPTSA